MVTMNATLSHEGVGTCSLLGWLVTSKLETGRMLGLRRHGNGRRRTRCSVSYALRTRRTHRCIRSTFSLLQLLWPASLLFKHIRKILLPVLTATHGGRRCFRLPPHLILKSGIDHRRLRWSLRFPPYLSGPPVYLLQHKSRTIVVAVELKIRDPSIRRARACPPYVESPPASMFQTMDREHCLWTDSHSIVPAP